MEITQKQFDELFPIACEWAKQQEKFIITNGVPLNEDQQIDAYLIGIKAIQKVRLLKVDTIPIPSIIELQRVGKDVGLLSPSTIGITFGYGICIRQDFWNDRRLIAHELCHTMQCEKLGGIEAFLEQYLKECIALGYPYGALEQEARKVETQFLD